MSHRPARPKAEQFLPHVLALGGLGGLAWGIEPFIPHIQRDLSGEGARLGVRTVWTYVQHIWFNADFGLTPTVAAWIGLVLLGVAGLIAAIRYGGDYVAR